MANTHSERQERQKQEKQSQGQERSAIERTRANPPAGMSRAGQGSSLALMRRLSEDMDRLFGEFFGGSSPLSRISAFGETTRWPEIEAFRRGDKLVIRADVPGLSKDDIHVEVVGDELCISGERHNESERKEAGYYMSERTYGSFCRTIALPPGAKVDTASASFDKGVLEIEIEAPEKAARGRKIEVREQPSH